MARIGSKVSAWACVCVCACTCCITVGDLVLYKNVCIMCGEKRRQTEELWTVRLCNWIAWKDACSFTSTHINPAHLLFSFPLSFFWSSPFSCPFIRPSGMLTLVAALQCADVFLVSCWEVTIAMPFFFSPKVTSWWWQILECTDHLYATFSLTAHHKTWTQNNIFFWATFVNFLSSSCQQIPCLRPKPTFNISMYLQASIV